VTELDQGRPRTAAGAGRAASGPSDGPVAEGAHRYLTFRLGEETFALPILDITEIIEYRSLTAVPMMPPFVRGVLNLRGRVVPVVDLAARFGRGGTTLGRRTAIVIVETPGAEDGTGDRSGQDFGIVVDAVNDVVHVGDQDIEPAPAFGGGIRSDFIAGMARRGGDFVIVLDVDRVLSLDEMLELGRACVEGPAPARDGAGEVASSGAPQR
jgi:purine-binding chemotaxis protein CheW